MIDPTSPELKPCPFCGEAASLIYATNYYGNYFNGFQYYVKCSTCLAETPHYDHPVIPAAKEYAIAYWNYRPLEDALQARIAELEELNTRQEKMLDEVIEILADEGSISCPALKINYICNNGNGCNKLDSVITTNCWKEYLLSKSKEEQ